MTSPGEKITMIVIDGAQGEGGGQIFRSSLTLAMCLAKAVCIKNIRAGRAKPGLLRQHLTCLRAAQQLCDAKVSGDELGSREVSFEPGATQPGTYRFAVGSAGSSTLVFQTLYLPLFFAAAKSEIVLEGGTHNGFAPSYDYIAQCFLPLLARMGYQATAELHQYGFYPAGGGKWQVSLAPVTELSPLQLLERGPEQARQAVAISSQIAEHINQRELAQVANHTYWAQAKREGCMVKSVGPGNLFSLRVFHKNVNEFMEVVGEKKLSAERVAKRALKAWQAYQDAGVPVGEYLADQLLLPMALGKGGEFLTLKPSEHLLSNIAVIKQFMGPVVSVNPVNKTVWQVQVAGRLFS